MKYFASHNVRNHETYCIYSIKFWGQLDLSKRNNLLQEQLTNKQTKKKQKTLIKVFLIKEFTKSRYSAPLDMCLIHFVNYIHRCVCACVYKKHLFQSTFRRLPRKINKQKSLAYCLLYVNELLYQNE